MLIFSPKQCIVLIVHLSACLFLSVFWFLLFWYKLQTIWHKIISFKSKFTLHSKLLFFNWSTKIREKYENKEYNIPSIFFSSCVFSYFLIYYQSWGWNLAYVIMVHRTRLDFHPFLTAVIKQVTEIVKKLTWSSTKSHGHKQKIKRSYKLQ